jgi:hypothetical protein
MLLQLNLENNPFFFIHYGFFTVFQLKFKMMLYNTISPLRNKYFSNYFILFCIIFCLRIKSMTMIFLDKSHYFS